MKEKERLGKTGEAESWSLSTLSLSLKA